MHRNGRLTRPILIGWQRANVIQTVSSKVSTLDARRLQRDVQYWLYKQIGCVFPELFQNLGLVLQKHRLLNNSLWQA